jgi:SAM-dependent methyltransferase
MIRRIARGVLRPLRPAARRLRYLGWKRFCPICEKSVRCFVPYGVYSRPGVGCPLCGSAERHRLAWLVLQKASGLLDGADKRLLHFAPEGCLRTALARRKQLRYVTADLFDPSVDCRVDVAALPFADASFDAAICLMVLQHVVDPSLSLKEIRRVLRPGGWALLSVPIFGETTVEHGTGGFIVSVPTHGFHGDNARRTFGDNFEAFVQGAGFTTRRFYGPELMDAAALERAKVVEMSSPVFLCTRV